MAAGGGNNEALTDSKVVIGWEGLNKGSSNLLDVAGVVKATKGKAGAVNWSKCALPFLDESNDRSDLQPEINNIRPTYETDPTFKIYYLTFNPILKIVYYNYVLFTIFYTLR